VAREPLFGLPGLRLHLLVGRAVAFVGGLVPASARWSLVGGPLPRIGLGLGVVKGRRAQGQPGLGRVQRRPARPARASAARTLASSTARPAIRSRWASWTTSWARSATLREVV
jgi:hypothetical protein